MGVGEVSSDEHADQRAGDVQGRLPGGWVEGGCYGCLHLQAGRCDVRGVQGSAWRRERDSGGGPKPSVSLVGLIFHGGLLELTIIF
jgi:hypothetical protein